MNILAFDLGASGGKLFLASIENNKAVIQDIHRFDNISYPINNGLYWDIISIYKEMNIGIKKAIKLTNDNIDSFAIDSFSNDFGFIDKNGDLLSPIRCYRDERTKRHESRIYGKLSKHELYQLTGNQIAPFNTLMQLAAICEDKQDYLFEKADKLLFIPDLLIHFLSDVSVAEYTMASVSQLYDFSKNDWCEEILNTYHIPRNIFGTLTKPGTMIGQTKSSYNRFMKTKGFPIALVCEHDTASAYLSSPINTNCALISCGTWALIGTELNAPIITEEGFKYNLANEGSISGHHRLLRNVMSSWLIQESRQYFKENGQNFSFSELEDLASHAASFQFLFDPDDDLFYQPGNIPEKIQQYCLQNFGHSPQTVGEIIRCIYESLAMKFRWTIEKLESISKKDLPLINMMGGGCKAAMLCQFVANVSGKPVVAGPEEASALGNIAMQLVSLEAVSSLSDAQSILSSTYTLKTYHPQAHEEWDNEYRNFLKLTSL